MQCLGSQDELIRDTMQREDKLFAQAILSSSSCSLVRCLSYKEFLGKGLVQLRAEARIGVSEVIVDSTKKYSLVKYYNMPDAPVATIEMSDIRVQLSLLEATMRDIGNLASRFRSDESSSIAQSIRWVSGSKSLMPGVLRMTLTTASETKEEEIDPSEEGETDQEIVERAHRLSFAALNAVPLSSKAEREAVTQARLTAMDTYSLLSRLRLTNQLMSSQLAQFSARCSLKF